MDWLAKIAPTLASVLLGPAAGLVVNSVGSLLGMSDATVDKIKVGLENAQLSETQIVELRKIEAELKIKEQELGFRFEELAYKNTQGAREMQMATQSRFPAILSGFITVGFFGILGWMLHDENVVNSEPILIMLGSLGAAFGAVVQFWLGSTNGSQIKSQLLANSTPSR